MARLRFATAQEVFEAFPDARRDIRAAPSEEPPLAYIKALLESPTPEDAIAFCAYVLPRREAVWWACQCLRMLNSAPPADEAMAIQAAETWVRQPEDHLRLAAARAGLDGDRRSAGAFVAQAAAFSGGMVTVDGASVASPPAMTAAMARAAVLVALSAVGVKERREKLRACVHNAVRLMQDEKPGGN